MSFEISPKTTDFERNSLAKYLVNEFLIWIWKSSFDSGNGIQGAESQFANAWLTRFINFLVFSYMM